MFSQKGCSSQKHDELTADELTRNANVSYERRNNTAENRRKIGVLEELFGPQICTYCRCPKNESPLFPLILAKRPGFACKVCIKKFLL